MDVAEAIKIRRSLRSLDPADITCDIIEKLGRAIQLAPSCYNNQAWRFLFVYDAAMREKAKTALSAGNEWASAASLYVIAYSKKDDDCVTGDGRLYHLFDDGIAAGFVMLQATELGLVCHPIAGYDPEKTKAIFGIPGDYEVICWLVVGRHADEPSPMLSEKQQAAENERPPRKDLAEIVFHNRHEG